AHATDRPRRTLETDGRGGTDLPHIGLACCNHRVPVFPFVADEPACAGLVLAALSPCRTVPIVCIVELCLAPGVTRLSIPRRAVSAVAGSIGKLVHRLWCFRRVVRRPRPREHRGRCPWCSCRTSNDAIRSNTAVGGRSLAVDRAFGHGLLPFAG